MLVVQSPEGLAKLGKTTNVYGAPLAIIVCKDSTSAWVRPYDGKNLSEIDSSIVTDHMMLQATDLGLGTLWVCYFDPEIVRSEFSIPQELEPLHVLAIGYTDQEPLSSDRHLETRKPLEKTVFFESF